MSENFVLKTTFATSKGFLSSFYFEMVRLSHCILPILATFRVLVCLEQEITLIYGASEELAYNITTLFFTQWLIFQAWNRVLIWHFKFGISEVPLDLPSGLAPGLARRLTRSCPGCRSPAPVYITTCAKTSFNIYCFFPQVVLFFFKNYVQNEILT